VGPPLLPVGIVIIRGIGVVIVVVGSARTASLSDLAAAVEFVVVVVSFVVVVVVISVVVVVVVVVLVVVEIGIACDTTPGTPAGVIAAVVIVVVGPEAVVDGVNNCGNL
jgi:hypothetical protein